VNLVNKTQTKKNREVFRKQASKQASKQAKSQQ
jgi:hypothetical protein